MVKTTNNWKSAFGWTALVAAVTCAFFATLMIGSLYLGGVFDPDTGAADGDADGADTHDPKRDRDTRRDSAGGGGRDNGRKGPYSVRNIV